MCSRGQGDGRWIWMNDVGFFKNRAWSHMGKHHSVDESAVKILPWSGADLCHKPNLSQHTQEHLEPLAVPQVVRGELCPFNAGIDWFMGAWWIERSSTELHWVMVTLLLLHKPLPICPITQKQNDNNTIYEIYIHDYKLILFGQTSSSGSSLALQFPNSIYGIGLGILSIKLGDKCGGWWSLLPLAPTSTCVTGGKKML